MHFHRIGTGVKNCAMCMRLLHVIVNGFLALIARIQRSSDTRPEQQDGTCSEIDFNGNIKSSSSGRIEKRRGQANGIVRVALPQLNGNTDRSLTNGFQNERPRTAMMNMTSRICPLLYFVEIHALLHIAAYVIATLQNLAIVIPF